MSYVTWHVKYDLEEFFKNMMRYAALLPEEPNKDGWRTYIESHCFEVPKIIIG